jgi:hypothetical protein
MPQHIKDWVMNNSNHERSHTATESAHPAYAFNLNDIGSDSDDPNGLQFIGNIQVPIRI